MDAFERSFRVLVVEDECLLAVDLADLLTEFGHDVCGFARTAQEAFDAAEKLRPDLVVMDVRLANGTSGLDAAKRICTEFGIRSCFVSGSIDGEMMEEARASGPIGFLAKPLQPQLLKATLARAALTLH